MNATNVRECESVTRVIAVWGSVVAAVIFGIGFLTDRALSYHIVIGQAEQIALVLLVFAGYLLAWKKSCEACGSILALVAVGAFWAWCRIQNPESPNPFFLVIAVPALFHLLAVAFHRWTLLVKKD
jgi:hypothetical protein